MTQKKPKLGVLALMLEDYLPLFPGIDRAQTAYVNEVLDGLRDAAEFVFPHAAMNRAQIEALAAQYNHEGLDGILILLLTYSQGAYLVRALEENHLPLALALIQPEQTVRPDFIEWDYTVNQGIHGSQDQANVMTRMGANCIYYAGNRCDGSFAQFVADFGRAAMTVRAMKRMRIGVIGKLPGMGDVITDDMAIYRCLGPELVYDSIGTVRRFCAEVEADAVKTQMEAERAVFDIDPTLDEPTHAAAARVCVFGGGGRGRAFLAAVGVLDAGAGPRVHSVADASDGGPLPSGLCAGRNSAGCRSAACGHAVSVLPA